MEIEVLEPLVETKETIPYVSYLIVGLDSNGSFEVRRRYREFKMLREKLVERWMGLYVPPIASKKLTVL